MSRTTSKPVSYRDYYQTCRHAYHGPRTRTASVYDLYVEEVIPSERTGPTVELPPDFDALVDSLARKVGERLENRDYLYPNPAIQHFADQLHDFWDIEELELLAAMLAPQLEEKVYGTRVLINQVNIIRTRVTAEPPVSSWLWHYDDNPEEAVKILMYLTDVDERSGAFEYLTHEETGQQLKVPSSKVRFGVKAEQVWPRSRVPKEEIARLTRLGYRPRKVVGPKGTMILFDNNCIHRATIPERGCRDVVILNFRPCHKRIRPYISRKHTGSWDFDSKSWDPYTLEV